MRIFGVGGLARGLTFTYSHFLIWMGIAALGVGVKLTIFAAGGDRQYDDTAWVFCLGAAVCMLGLGVVQLVTPPRVLDLDVVLRFGTAALALVLLPLSFAVHPLAVLWTLAIALTLQVVFELLEHEQHRPAEGRALARPGRARRRGSALAHERHLDAAPISSPTMRRCRSSTRSTGTPSSSTTRSSGRTPAGGRAALDHLDDLDALLAPEPRASLGGRGAPEGDAEIRAADAAIRHERGDDLPRCGVDRHRQSEADSGDGGVDADDATLPSASAAGVAGLRRRRSMTFSTMRPAERARTGSERPRCETTPAVTELEPVRFPIATTS